MWKAEITDASDMGAEQPFIKTCICAKTIVNYVQMKYSRKKKKNLDFQIARIWDGAIEAH